MTALKNNQKKLPRQQEDTGIVMRSMNGKVNQLAEDIRNLTALLTSSPSDGSSISSIKFCRPSTSSDPESFLTLSSDSHQAPPPAIIEPPPSVEDDPAIEIVQSFQSLVMQNNDTGILIRQIAVSHTHSSAALSNPSLQSKIKITLSPS